MLIFAWFFVQRQNQSHQPLPYPLKFHPSHEADTNYPRFDCTTWPECFGATASEWCLVPTPCVGIKLIYYTSIKQQEQIVFRQIKFWRLRFKCKSTTHCMLTYHFCPLSNPVKPELVSMIDAANIIIFSQLYAIPLQLLVIFCVNQSFANMT